MASPDGQKSTRWPDGLSDGLADSLGELPGGGVASQVTGPHLEHALQDSGGVDNWWLLLIYSMQIRKLLKLSL